MPIHMSPIRSLLCVRACVCCEVAFIVPKKLGRSRGSVCFTFSDSPLFYWWRTGGIMLNAVDPESLHRLSCCVPRVRMLRFTRVMLFDVYCVVMKDTFIVPK